MNPITSAPNKVDDLLRKAITFMNAGLLDEALECIDLCLIRSTNELVLLYRGIILSRKGLQEMALTEFDKLLEIDPTNTLAIINKSIILQQLDRLGEALHCYDRLLQLDSTDTCVLENKAKLLIELVAIS